MLATLRQRDFGLLWLAGLISIAGDFAMIVALPLHVYRLTDSTIATAATFAGTFLPGVLLGSLAGVFVDRWDRKRTMVVVDFARAVVLLPLLLFPDRLEVIYAVATVQGTLGLFFGPAESALLPRLVGEDRLVTANALNALNDNLGFLVGPALGAALYAANGIRGAALVDALSFLGSALLISLIAADARPHRSEGAATGAGSAWTRMVGEWLEGLRFMRRSTPLRVLFAATALMGVAEGFFVTLGLSPLVLDVLEGTPAQVGWLGAAQGVGGLIASVVVARAGARFTTRWLIGGGGIGLGLADLTAFNSRRFAGPGTPAVGVAMACMVVAGFPAVAGGTGRQVLIQTETSDAYRGRVFGALRVVNGASMLVGLGFAGVLGEILPLVPVLSVSACLRVLGGFIALRYLPRRTETVREPAETAA